MKLVRWQLLFFFPVLLSCGPYEDATESTTGSKASAIPGVDMIRHGRWLALGDSDFDSYQADDFKRRVNPIASNADCVLSPVEVLARDGRDFGQFAKWEDDRRHDYRRNFSLSGASIRNSIFGWREIFSEDAKAGIIEMAREVRDSLLGREPRLGNAIISEPGSSTKSNTPSIVPIVVQINIGINDINRYNSLYNQFSSMDSNYSWVDSRTDALKNVVDEMLDL